MAITLTISERTLRNVSAGTDPVNIDDSSGTAAASIGCEYEFTARLEVGGTTNAGTPITDWQNARVYFNPALFVDQGYIYPAGPPPTPGFAFVFAEALDGGPYPMALSGMGAQTNAETNGTCQLVEVDDGALELRYRFRVTSDMRRHITTGTPVANNSIRLRRNLMSDGTFSGSVWPNVTGQHVFRTPPNRTVVRTIIMVQRGDASYSRYDHFFAFAARWYNANKSGTGPAELGAFAITTLERNGGPVTNLSCWEATTLRMRIPKGSGWTADTAAGQCECALILTDNVANLGGEFMDDYGQPFQAGTITDDGTHWQFERVIEPGEVVLNRNYMLVLIARAVNNVTPTNIVSNSFNSSPLRADALPPVLDVPISGHILDYDREPSTDYVKTTVVDHIEARVILDSTGYDAAAGHPLGEISCAGGILITGAGEAAVNGVYCPDVDPMPGSTYSWTKVGGTYGEDTIYLESGVGGFWVITSGGTFADDPANVKYFVTSGPTDMDPGTLWGPLPAPWNGIGTPWGAGEPTGALPVPTVKFGTAAGAPWATGFDQDLRRIRLNVVKSGDSSLVMSRSWQKIGADWVGVPTTHANNIVVTDQGSGLRQVAMQLPMHFLNESGLPDFAGETILLQWSFEFDYPALGWTVSYDYTQAADVKDFKGFSAEIQSIEFFDFATGFPLQSLCDGDKVLVKVTLNPSLIAGRTFHLRAYWNLAGYGYSDDVRVRPYDGVNEEEGYNSPTGFFQLDDANLEGVPGTFNGDGVALFVFDHSDIPVGERPRLYVIAQPIPT